MTDEHTESRAEFKSGVRALLSIHTEIHMGRLPVSMLEDALQGLWKSHEARIASLTAERDDARERVAALETRLVVVEGARDMLNSMDDAGQTRMAALEKAARNARDHFYEFNATPDGLAASGFGDAMDWLDVALSTTQPAPLKPQEGV